MVCCCRPLAVLHRRHPVPTRNHRDKCPAKMRTRQLDGALVPVHNTGIMLELGISEATVVE